MYSALPAFLLTIVALSACAPIPPFVAKAEPLFSFDESVIRELGWPAVDRKFAGGCPNLAGSYSRSGDMYMQIVRHAQPEIIREKTNPFLLFGEPRSVLEQEPMPELRMHEPASQEERSAPGVFWLRQTPDAIQFRQLDQRDASQILYVTWKRVAGDYHCEAGLLIVKPIYGSGASSQWTEHRGQEVLGKLLDGSIIYFNSVSIANTSFSVFRASQRTVAYTRYSLVP